MTQHRYLQLDVFADRAGNGNPLGVVFDAEGLDSAAMQAYAAWANLSETIFFLPPTTADADYRIRIFTPRQELPFAGHPSVGAAWAAIDAGLVDAGKQELVQDCKAGLLPVRIENRGSDRLIHVRTPRATRLGGGEDFPDLLRAATAGLPGDALLPALWNNGPSWWLVPLADEATVRTMIPDLAAIAALTGASEAVGLAVFARTGAGEHDVVVRAYCPADGIPEDPVTGSANACVAAMLHACGAMPGNAGRYLASQGREMGRNGHIEVEVDTQGAVWIGGRVQAVIRGRVDW